MPITPPDEVLRRICLAYPWSNECQGIAPIVPTGAETKAMWHGEGGYELASGKNVPEGTRCESVQLIPISQIGKKMEGLNAAAQAAVSAPNPNAVYMQFPTPKLEGLESVLFSNILIAHNRALINAFI